MCTSPKEISSFSLTCGADALSCNVGSIKCRGRLHCRGHFPHAFSHVAYFVLFLAKISSPLFPVSCYICRHVRTEDFVNMCMYLYNTAR